MIAEPKISQVWSKHFRSDAIDATTVGEHFDDMVDAAIDRAARRRASPASRRSSASISMRYWGQNYEQDVPVPDGPVTPGAAGARRCDAFHRLHEQFYGYSITGEMIELIRFNVTALGGASPRRAGSRPAMARPGGTAGGVLPGPAVCRLPVYLQRHGCPPATADATVEEIGSSHAGPAGSEGPPSTRYGVDLDTPA